MQHLSARILAALFGLFALLLTPQTASAHWSTRGPYGGSVTCFHVQDTLVWVGTAEGGVYRSTNSQLVAWRYYNYTGMTSPYIAAITSLGPKVYAGTSDAGIFVSADKGVTWAASNSGLANLTVTAMAAGNGRVFAGTPGGGVFLTLDSGLTWVASNTGLTSTNVTALALDSLALYAGTDGGGVFRSTDNGGSWTAINTGLTDLNIIAVATSGGTVYAATPSGVFQNVPGGPGWVIATTGLTGVQVNSLTAAGGILYAATSAGVYTTPTAAIAWAPATTGYGSFTEAVAAYNGRLVVGTLLDGIYRSTSLSVISWTPFNQGFNNLKGQAVYNDGMLVISATDKGLFVSRDLAATYERANNGLLDSLNVVCITWVGPDVYVGTRFGGVFMSADTGRNWVQENIGLTNLNIRSIHGTPDRIFVSTALDGVFSANTTTSTLSWVGASGLPSAIVADCFASGGTYTFLGGYGVGVYRTNDGQNWTNFNASLAVQEVTSIATSGQFVFVGTSLGGVHRSIMSSPNWAAMNTGLPSMDIQAMVASGLWVVAGFRGGVYATYDEGATWHAAGTQLYIPSFADIRGLSFTTNSTRIFAATSQNSMYSNGVGELPTAVAEVQPAIGAMEVGPNPNAGTFTVRFEGLTTKVNELVVVDNLGRTVHRIAAPSTSQPLTLALAVPAGLYHLRAVTPKGTLTRAVVVE